jgi:hypothetical protein
MSGDTVNWERMTVDEYASFQQANGMKLTRIDDIWWAEVRPFFYRPLLPYTEFNYKSKRYPPKSLIGGFKHAVPEEERTNSTLNSFVFAGLQKYSLKTLKDKRRNEIRKGLINFSAKRIENAKLNSLWMKLMTFMFHFIEEPNIII